MTESIAGTVEFSVCETVPAAGMAHAVERVLSNPCWNPQPLDPDWIRRVIEAARTSQS